MSRGRRRRTSTDSETPTTSLDSAIHPRPRRDLAMPDHREVQDDRTWQPTRQRVAKTVSGASPRIDVKKVQRVQSRLKFFKPSHQIGNVSSRLGFKLPHDVIVCLRRAMRREVLFALKRHRKGSGAKRRKRTYYSNVDCR